MYRIQIISRIKELTFPNLSFKAALIVTVRCLEEAWILGARSAAVLEMLEVLDSLRDVVANLWVPNTVEDIVMAAILDTKVSTYLQNNKLNSREYWMLDNCLMLEMSCK